MNTNGLSIVSVNILQLLNRLEQVQNAFSNLFDIICIQETCLKEKDTFSYAGYKIVRRDILDGETSGGICILIKNNISFTINDWYQSTSLQALSVKLHAVSNSNIDIITMYQNCHKDLESTVFDIASNNSDRYVILGDLNAPHIAIGSSYTHKRGEALLDYLETYNLFLYNSDEPTFYHRATGKPNILDVAISTTNLSENYSFAVGEDVGSDHLPIVLKLKTKILKSEPDIFRNIRNLNWDFYQARLSHHFTKLSYKTPETTDELNQIIIEIINMFTKALDETAPQNKHIKPKWWKFTEDIKEKVKLRRKFRRIQKKWPTPENNNNYNRINKDVKDLIKHQKQIDWQKMSDNLNIKNSQKAWQVIKKVNNSGTKSSRVQKLTNSNGDVANNDKEKADLMANHLHNKQSLPTDLYFDQEFKAKVDQHIDSNPLSYKPSTTAQLEVHTINYPVTIDELDNMLRKSQSSSSPGDDDISYKMLKVMPIEVKEFICAVYTTCLNWGYFPDEFKKATIKMIPKPRKDSSLVNNYRPISLLSCAGKILERVITSRLQTFLLNQNYISKYQCGFLPNKSTNEHICRLSQDVYTAFKKQELTLAVFLDIDGAFDRVWLNGLKYKLSDYGLPGNFIRIVSSFVNNRNFTVKEGNATSKVIFPEAGTPQGSVLSPLLFILYTNDFPTPNSNSITFSQYADDIAIWLSGKNIPHMQKKLQNYLDEIEKWCKKWLVKINPDKTQVNCFHRKRTVKPISLSLNNTALNLSHESTFLGITFDTRLTWKAHLDKVYGTFFRKCNILRSLSGRSWGAKGSNMIRLYKAWALPNIEYGCFAFLPVSDAVLNKIQVVQNKIIRAAFSLPKDTRITTLHETASLELVRNHINSIAYRSFMRVQISDIFKDSAIKYVQVDHKKAHKSPLDILKTNFNIDLNYI